MENMTKIIKICNEKRVNKVIFNNDEVIEFGNEELMKYNIVKDREFEEVELAELLLRIEADRAYKKGLDILLYKRNSKRKLEEKLLDKCFSRKSIESAVERLESAGYIDDMKFAKSYIRVSKDKKYKTKAQIENELLHKGVDISIISEAFCEFKSDFDENGEGEIGKIKQFINNKYYKLIIDSDLEYNKLISIRRALYNRGYKEEDANRALNEIIEENDRNSKGN